MSSSGGWTGDPESDIPLSVFAKHVVGLHAAGDMAFHKDFEAVHQARAASAAATSTDASSVLNGQIDAKRAECAKNGAASGRAASTFPDILGGGRGE